MDAFSSCVCHIEAGSPCASAQACVIVLDEHVIAVQGPGQGAWQTHYAPDGRPYYHNASTGATQWEAPAGTA